MLAQQSICSGSIHSYAVDESENNGQGTLGSVYTWQISGGDFLGEITVQTPSSNHIEIDWGATSAGVYNLEVVESNALGCQSSQNIEITLINLEEWSLSDQYLCPDQESIWVEGPEGMQSYEWKDETGNILAQTPYFSIAEEGQFSLRVQQDDCTITEVFSVIRVNYPHVQFEVVDDQDIWIEAIGGKPPYQYQLLDTDGNLVRDWQSNPLFTNLESGTYQARVRNTEGFCKVQLDVYLIPITNVLTPNNDGLNDVWDIRFLENKGLIRATIYDKYGKTLAELSPYTTLIWDGKYKQRSIPTTTYWYILEFENDNKIYGMILIKNGK